MKSNRLQRTIGLIPATAIGLGAMLGAGIFVFPGLAGGDAGMSAIFSFIIGGSVALLVAFCTAELATAMPESGGAYYYISRSFGKFWGTLAGIAQWVGLIFACAFYMTSFAEYILKLLSDLNVDGMINGKFFSISFTLLLLGINILGTKRVGRVQNIMVITLTIILVVIFSYGLMLRLGIETDNNSFSHSNSNGSLSILTTSALIFTAYLGFVQIANIAGDIKKPSKNLPRALIWSVLIAASLYVFIMLVCSLTFSQEQLNAYGEVATIEVSREILGEWGAMIVVFAAVLAALSSANASIISASRGVFALSRDQLLNKKVSKINARFGTPHIAVILVALPIVLLLFREQLEIFAEVASLLHLMLYGGICLSALKMRSSPAQWYVPTYRVRWIKPVAFMGTIACFGLVFFMQTTSILIGLSVLFGACFYYYIVLRTNKAPLDKPKPPHLDLNLFNPNILIPIDITQEDILLPDGILEALPKAKILLVGYKETPEQSEAEQSEEKFGEMADRNLKNIENQLKDAPFDFDKKLIFSHNLADQIHEVLEEEEIQYILNLEPKANIKHIRIPVFEHKQLNNKLRTFIHGFYTSTISDINAFLLVQESEDSESENQLIRNIEEHLGLVNIKLQSHEVLQNKNKAIDLIMREKTSSKDLVVWVETESNKSKPILKHLLENKDSEIESTHIIILSH